MVKPLRRDNREVNAVQLADVAIVLALLAIALAVLAMFVDD